MKTDISALRQNYALHTLDVADVNPNPIKQFIVWMQEAIDSQLPEPNAMILATATPDGQPAARVLLLKGIEDNGFVFYTNYESDKGREMAANPKVSMVFNWLGLHRQVRIEGTATKISEQESTEYFQSRPKESQIGAWTSPQSSVIENREILEEKYKALEQKYKDVDILPKPPHWGGYLLTPNMLEFWQGRPSRLHDRIVYNLEGKEWKIVRLAP